MIGATPPLPEGPDLGLVGVAAGLTIASDRELQSWPESELASELESELESELTLQSLARACVVNLAMGFTRQIRIFLAS